MTVSHISCRAYTDRLESKRGEEFLDTDVCVRARALNCQVQIYSDGGFRPSVGCGAAAWVAYAWTHNGTSWTRELLAYQSTYLATVSSAFQTEAVAIEHASAFVKLFAMLAEDDDDNDDANEEGA